MAITQRIEKNLERSPQWLFILIAGSAAMLTYFSMYAFRKPFAAATYSDVTDWTFLIDYKSTLVIAQVIGYALSKFAGIKIIAEMPPARRAKSLILMILIAHFALLLFAILPKPWNIAALFLNGLPLGLVWGLVFGFLEGRRVSEALGVILSISLIFSSGAVKSVGRYLLLEWQVPEVWMPFVTGCLFLPLLLLASIVLSSIPAPNKADEEERQKRITMDASTRKDFFLAYAPGLCALVASYVLLTTMRDFTDNYAADIWVALGYGDSSSIYTSSTLPVVIIVLFFLGSLMYVKRNLLALQLNLMMVFAGFALLALSTTLYQLHVINGLVWMITMQTGLYMGYIPFNCILFDRIVAATPKFANAGFLIYIADAFGYLGSIAILLVKNLMHAELPWIQFVSTTTLASGLVGVCLTGAGMAYFNWRLGKPHTQQVAV